MHFSTTVAFLIKVIFKVVVIFLILVTLFDDRALTFEDIGEAFWKIVVAFQDQARLFDGRRGAF